MLNTLRIAEMADRYGEIVCAAMGVASGVGVLGLFIPGISCSILASAGIVGSYLFARIWKEFLAYRFGFWIG